MSVDLRIHKYVKNQKRLLDLELKAEQEQTTDEKNDEERNNRVLSNLEVDHLEVGLMGRTVVQFSSRSVASLNNEGKQIDDDQDEVGKATEPLLPAHRFSTGDEVEIITKKNPSQNRGGVICALTDRDISVALFEDYRNSRNADTHKNTSNSTTSEMESGLFGSGPITLVPRSSAEVHKKYIKSLEKLEREGENHPFAGRIIRDIFSGCSEEVDVSNTNAPDIEPLNPNLDASQIEAIKFALYGSQSISLIYGPPGTGKTTTVAELIRQAVQVLKMKVLVTAPSNVAVDNVLERLVANQQNDSSKKQKASKQNNIRAVRLGHPARISKSILQYSLESLVQNADGTEIVRDIRKEMKTQLDLAANPKTRGLERRNAYREVKTLRKEIRQREEKVVESLLLNAQVVLSTNVGAAGSILDRYEKSHSSRPFDLVIIDEAAQALEISCFAPIFGGTRLVLAGDHQQLPPTIKSNRSDVQKELSKTLFERVMEKWPSVSRMLNIQYRMNKSIADWSSYAMYDGKLMSHESVKDRKLCQLSSVGSIDPINQKDDENDLLSITRNSPLLLIDTAGCYTYESVNSAGSKYNEGEAEILTKHLKNLISLGVKQQDIAVITPYNGQVEILRRLLLEEYPKLEIRSVDGFQGGEREAVVLSLVRSSERGELGIGFLKDKRRLNVAITRAKRQVAVICDSETVSKNDFLKQLVQWMEDNGEYLSAMEYIEDDAVVTNNEDYIKQLHTQMTKVESKSKCIDNKVADLSTSEEKVDVANNLSDSKKISIKKDHEEQISFFSEIAGDGESLECRFTNNEDIVFNLRQLCIRHGFKLEMEEKGGNIIATILKMDKSSGSNENVEVCEKMSASCNVACDDQNIIKKKDNNTSEMSVERIEFGGDKHVEDKKLEKNEEATKSEISANDPIAEPDSNMNSLLKSLAKERAARQQNEAPSKVLQKTSNKSTKKKGGKKLGGTQIKSKPQKDTSLEDLDDMAFLDAQIEKVQTSHGRKINASGSNYKTIVNGILISKPKPKDEKKKNTRVSKALNDKLKSAQQSRRGGKAKKK